MHFWRIVNNKVYTVYETDNLGFSKDNPSYIPDEYLENNEFVIMRTCFGIGDWGIISSIPRKLKEKYPNCKVYIPSEKMLIDLFGNIIQHNPWERKFKVSEDIFKNNPYVDDFIDSYEGEIFHDHYRVYEGRDDEPLAEQMLRFWQFSNEEINDIQPELYFSNDEIELGNNIIHKYTNGKFGTLLLSNRYDFTSNDIIQSNIDPDLFYFYWTKYPLRQCQININNGFDIRNLDLRIQLYLKTKSKHNIGNQCGVNDCIPRYSRVITIQRQVPLYHNYVDGEEYIYNEFKHIILKDIPDKFKHKDTMSRKAKSDIIDFFKDKNYNCLEIGSAFGDSLVYLSKIFKSVIGTEIDNNRILKIKEKIKDIPNATILNFNVYSEKWNFTDIDVVLIDCMHIYYNVKMDINNAINLNPKYLIFDDYGLFADVRKAVDEFIDNGKLKVITKIGYTDGILIESVANPIKTITLSEGLICEVLY